MKQPVHYRVIIKAVNLLVNLQANQMISLMTKLPAKELIALIKTNRAQENQDLVNQVISLMTNPLMTKLPVFHLIVQINQMAISLAQENQTGVIQTVSTELWSFILVFYLNSLQVNQMTINQDQANPKINPVLTSLTNRQQENQAVNPMTSLMKVTVRI